MSKETLSLILSIVMLSIVLFLLLFMMHEISNSSLKKLNREKMLNDHNKRLKVSKETINVNNRTIIFQYFSPNGSYSDTRTPSTHPHFVTINKYEIDKKYNRGKKIIGAIINVFLVLLIGVLLAFGIYSQVTKSIYTVNNSTYVTIATDSMSEKNEANKYLFDLKLDDQIETFSLIKLDEIEKDEKIEIYGIYAYKNEEDKLIVHRVISKTIRNNVTYYTFKGDANELSDYYLVKEDDILFKYNGHKNVPLGYFVSFMGSLIGDITLLYLIIVLFALEYYDHKKERLVKKDLELYIEELNALERTKLNK